MCQLCGYEWPDPQPTLTTADLIALLRQFVGFISADVPELHHVEVPRLAESVERFMAVADLDTLIARLTPQDTK
jgi:hypothetical protein